MLISKNHAVEAIMNDGIDYLVSVHLMPRRDIMSSGISLPGLISYQQQSVFHYLHFRSLAFHSQRVDRVPVVDSFTLTYTP